MSLPRYPKYKDSGVEWLGEVPEHWELVPLKHMADFINGDAFKPSEWAESGIPIIRIQNLNVSEEFNYYQGEVEPRYLVHDGDLLFGWSGNRGTSFGPFLWRHKEVCALNQHIFRVMPRSINKYSLFWILKAVTAHVEDQAHGIIGMVHITKGDLGAISVPTPSVAEQSAIAGFLEYEMSKIDALVEEQRRLIELLKEKRQVVISHAVTKGLNPDATMKDSGVFSLGSIPSHWSVRSVNAIARVGNGSTPHRERLEYWNHGSYPWLTSTVVNQEEVTEAEEFVTETALLECHLPRVSAPAVLIGITGQGRTRGMASTLRFEATINQHIAYVSPRDACVSVDFLRRVFDSLYSLLRTESEGGGSTKGAITCEQILRLKVGLPPLNEQLQIVEWLTARIGHCDELVAEASRAIDLLQERRTALISAAVTGKIDVRGMAKEQTA